MTAVNIMSVSVEIVLQRKPRIESTTYVDVHVICVVIMRVEKWKFHHAGACMYCANSVNTLCRHAHVMIY